MRIAVTLYALALIVRVLLIALFPHPAYPDSYYYADVAHALLAGRGFSVDFIYSFADVGGHLPAAPVLPIPSNGYWLPLASLVQLPSIWLLGGSGLASALPFALVGSLAAPMTWRIAVEAGSTRRVALAAGVAVAVPAAAAIFMAQPDNFALYQVLGTAALWLTARGLAGRRGSFALAGLMVGLASLSRNDGVLLGVVVALAFAWDRLRPWRSAGGRPQIPWRYALASLALFLACVGPWYVRQLATYGAISPAALRSLFLTSYDQFNSVSANVSLASFLNQGLASLLTSRALGLLAAIGTFAGEACPIVLVPFIIIGAAQRRSVAFGPFLTYALLFTAATGLFFPLYVPFGTFIHSAVALVPYSYILGMEGLASATRWVARRRAGWQEERAERMFLAAGAATAVFTAAVFAAATVVPAWSHDRETRLAAGAALTALHVPASDRLMTADPAGFEYLTGRGGVVTPADPLATVEVVARDYDVRWLVLERDQIVASLGPVLTGRVRPSWIGPPVFTAPPPAGTADGIPALALYPVCFSPGDARCASAGLHAGASPAHGNP